MEFETYRGDVLYCEEAATLRQDLYEHGGSRLWVEVDGRRNLLVDTYHTRELAEDVRRFVRGWLEPTPQRPQIVCLCGSSRFVEVMAVLAWELERDEGCIVLSLHLLPASYSGVQADHQAEAEGVAAHMDQLHRRKIDLADRVLVVNVGGYVGESTAAEIEYTRSLGKPVAFLES